MFLYENKKKACFLFVGWFVVFKNLTHEQNKTIQTRGKANPQFGPERSPPHPHDI